MNEELTPLQNATIAHAVKKLYNTEKIVNYNIDFSKWKIKNLYKDSLWVQLIDEPDADTIVKNGIAIPVSKSKGLYRLGKVIMCGPDVKYAMVGEFIRFPQGVGAPYEQPVEGFRTWLIREDAVMAVVEFEGTEDELSSHLENDVHIQV